MFQHPLPLHAPAAYRSPPFAPAPAHTALARSRYGLLVEGDIDRSGGLVYAVRYPHSWSITGESWRSGSGIVARRQGSSSRHVHPLRQFLPGRSNLSQNKVEISIHSSPKPWQPHLHQCIIAFGSDRFYIRSQSIIRIAHSAPLIQRATTCQHRCLIFNWTRIDGRNNNIPNNHRGATSNRQSPIGIIAVRHTTGYHFRIA